MAYAAALRYAARHGYRVGGSVACDLRCLAQSNPAVTLAADSPSLAAARPPACKQFAEAEASRCTSGFDRAVAYFIDSGAGVAPAPTPAASDGGTPGVTAAAAAADAATGVTAAAGSGTAAETAADIAAAQAAAATTAATVAAAAAEAADTIVGTSISRDKQPIH